MSSGSVEREVKQLMTWLFGQVAPCESKPRPSDKEMQRSLITLTGDDMTITVVRTSRVHYMVRRYRAGKRSSKRIFGFRRALAAVTEMSASC